MYMASHRGPGRKERAATRSGRREEGAASRGGRREERAASRGGVTQLGLLIQQLFPQSSGVQCIVAKSWR